MDDFKINVTKTFFPPIEEYTRLLEKVWKSGWLTNRGPLALELENRLENLFEVNHVIAMSNGTVPLQIAVKAFGEMGQIITTPFSYVATTSSIVWENCQPVFVDIDPNYLTIDEDKIEAAINQKTSAILATHVFGNSCNVEKIREIAEKHNLRIIYDAAHSFGVKYKGQSIFKFGDISTCSFHATKLFHTGEGGAVFCSDKKIRDQFFLYHNFGHKTPLELQGVGINGKISELQAAMGLTVLPYLEQLMAFRKSIVDFYLQNLSWSSLRTMVLRPGTEWNYSYFPVIFESEEVLLSVQHELNKKSIYPRRYFYPSLNTLDYVSSEAMPVAECIAKTILCLPLYHNLDIRDVETIIATINLIVK